MISGYRGLASEDQPKINVRAQHLHRTSPLKSYNDVGRKGLRSDLLTWIQGFGPTCSDRCSIPPGGGMQGACLLLPGTLRGGLALFPGAILTPESPGFFFHLSVSYRVCL